MISYLYYTVHCTDYSATAVLFSVLANWQVWIDVKKKRVQYTVSSLVERLVVDLGIHVAVSIKLKRLYIENQNDELTVTEYSVVS